MPEPVFGIIKSVMHFRQFLLRGLEAVRGVVVGNDGLEYSQNGVAWNLKADLSASFPSNRLLPHRFGIQKRASLHMSNITTNSSPIGC